MCSQRITMVKQVGDQEIIKCLTALMKHTTVMINGSRLFKQTLFLLTVIIFSVYKQNKIYVPRYRYGVTFG